MKCKACTKRPAMSVRHQYCNPCVVRFYAQQQSRPTAPSKSNAKSLEVQEGTQTPPNKTKPLEKAGESGNNMTKKKATINTVERYEVGANERLDRILGDSPLPWIVQGNKGRRPVLAETEAEAREKYLAIDAPAFEESND